MKSGMGAAAGAGVRTAVNRPGEGTYARHPAMGNLVLTRGWPEPAAYHATIVDLAARGYLSVPAGPRVGGPVWFGSQAAVTDDSALPEFEQLVLCDVRRQLGPAGSAPLEELASLAGQDLVWRRFQRSLRAEARTLGLYRLLPPRTLLPAALVLTAGAALAFALVMALPRPQAQVAGAALLPSAALVLFAGLPALLRNRLTSAGAALARRWRRRRREFGDPGTEAGLQYLPDLGPAALSRLAAALAAGSVSALPPVQAGKRGRARGRRASQPSVAWSSVTGSWRLVPIGGVPRPRSVTAGVARLAAAVWLAAMAVRVATVPGASNVAGLAMLTVAAVIAIPALAKIARAGALPRRAVFDGQVIARWTCPNGTVDGELNEQPYIAVDDGQRAWTFAHSGAYQQLKLGYLVRLTVNARAGTLIKWTITSADSPGQD